MDGMLPEMRSITRRGSDPAREHVAVGSAVLGRVAVVALIVWAAVDVLRTTLADGVLERAFW